MTSAPRAKNRFARWLADDSCPARPPDLAVYRYKGMTWALPLFALIPVGIAVDNMVKFRSVGFHVVMPIFCWLVTIVIWQVVVGSAVRVRAGALVIDNLLVRHVIPWERFAGLFVEQGRGMFARLDSGAEVSSATFGRSLAEALTGYAHMRETLDRIRMQCRAARSGHSESALPPAYERRLIFPWQASLAFLAFFEAVSWAIFFVRGGLQAGGARPPGRCLLRIECGFDERVVARQDVVHVDAVLPEHDAAA